MAKPSAGVKEDRQVNFRCPTSLYKELRRIGAGRIPRLNAGQMIQEAVAQMIAREEKKR